MVISLNCPAETKGVTARNAAMPGGKQLEIFTHNGIDYVRGKPADIVVNFTRISNTSMSLRERNKVKSANALCSLHRGYRAKRKPRSNCEQCWRAYDSHQTNVIDTAGASQQGEAG